MSYTRDQIIEAELRRLVKDVEAYLEWHQKEGPFPILECDLKYSHLALDSSPRNATPIPPASPAEAREELAQLRAENERLSHAVACHVDAGLKHLEQIATLTKERYEAREALEKYGRHWESCEDYVSGGKEKCTCGLYKAKKGKV